VIPIGAIEPPREHHRYGFRRQASERFDAGRRRRTRDGNWAVASACPTLSSLRLGELRRASNRALGKAYEDGAGTNAAGHQVDVFLFAPGSDA
jgi:hypothetical protein